MSQPPSGTGLRGLRRLLCPRGPFRSRAPSPVVPFAMPSEADLKAAAATPRDSLPEAASRRTAPASGVPQPTTGPPPGSALRRWQDLHAADRPVLTRFDDPGLPVCGVWGAWACGLAAAAVMGLTMSLSWVLVAKFPMAGVPGSRWWENVLCAVGSEIAQVRVVSPGGGSGPGPCMAQTPPPPTPGRNTPPPTPGWDPPPPPPTAGPPEF